MHFLLEITTSQPGQATVYDGNTRPPVSVKFLSRLLKGCCVARASSGPDLCDGLDDPEALLSPHKPACIKAERETQRGRDASQQNPTRVAFARMSQVRNATLPVLTAKGLQRGATHGSREERRSAGNIYHKEKLPPEEIAGEESRQTGPLCWKEGRFL